METTEKISLSAGILIAIFSLYSYFVSPVYTTSFGLDKAGYLLGFLISLLVAYMIYKNEKGKSKQIAQVLITLSMILFFFLVSVRSFSSGDAIIVVASFITFIAAFAISLSSLQLAGFSKTRVIFLFFIAAAIVIFVQSVYVEPSTDVARFSGTVLSDNWWEGLNWIKNNTSECSVIATYWDPGHFIRAIANRAVIFDGATQGAQRTVPASHEDGLAVTPYENGIKYIVSYKDGNATTSRINDVAITLMTENESFAIEILEKYRAPGCDSMYYIASSDLIGKSVWWTYFSTWDPAVSKGTPYSYQVMQLERVRPLVNQDALVYSYPIGQNAAFLIIGTNNTFRAFLQQGNSQPVAVETLIYYSDTGGVLFNNEPDAPVKGTILLQQDKRLAIYMPPELENSMFTRMFLYNGAGLNNFEFVNQWGGEVKLFKVNFP